MIALFAQAPALPLHTAGKYVAAAYVIFALVIVIYVGIMGRRLARNQRELVELKALVAERQETGDPADVTAPATTTAGTVADEPEHSGRVA